MASPSQASSIHDKWIRWLLLQGQTLQNDPASLSAASGDVITKLTLSISHPRLYMLNELREGQINIYTVRNWINEGKSIARLIDTTIAAVDKREQSDIHDTIRRESRKLDYLHADINDICDTQNKQFIVMVQQPLTLWLLYRYLTEIGYPCAFALDFGIADNPDGLATHRFIERFNRGGVYKIFIAQYGALDGVGLQTQCHTMRLFEPPQDPDQEVRAIGLIRRIGQTQPSEVMKYSVPATIDKWCWTALDRLAMRYGGLKDLLKSDIARIIELGCNVKSTDPGMEQRIRAAVASFAAD